MSMSIVVRLHVVKNGILRYILHEILLRLFVFLKTVGELKFRCDCYEKFGLRPNFGLDFKSQRKFTSSGVGSNGVSIQRKLRKLRNARTTVRPLCSDVWSRRVHRSGKPHEIPFPWESHGNWNSHTAHDGNGNGNKANGNGNSIYFTRVKIPKIIVMH